MTDLDTTTSKPPAPLWAKITVGIFGTLLLVILAGLLTLAAIGIWRSVLA
jgi:hypothetical protein